MFIPSEGKDPNKTRDIIDKLLVNDSKAETLETICLLIREISICAIHGPNNSPLTTGLNSNAPQRLKNNRPTSSSVSNHTSKFGTIALPKVIDYVEDFENDQSESASDVPSESDEEEV